MNRASTVYYVGGGAAKGMSDMICCVGGSAFENVKFWLCVCM